MLNEKFVSKFDEETPTILDNYEVSPLMASLELESRNNLIGIDTIKAYTSNLHELDYIPVFNVFDRFVECDEHVIEDYTMYHTKLEDNMETRIFVGVNYAVVYGQHLKQCGITFTIISYHRTSNLIESISKGIIYYLYSSGLDEKHLKTIINFLIGKCGKTQNVKNIVKIYLYKDEAYYYAKLTV